MRRSTVLSHPPLLAFLASTNNITRKVVNTLKIMPSHVCTTFCKSALRYLFQNFLRF